jgi:hypothetical protein
MAKVTAVFIKRCRTVLTEHCRHISPNNEAANSSMTGKAPSAGHLSTRGVWRDSVVHRPCARTSQTRFMLSRTARPVIRAPAFPGRPRPGNTETAGRHTGMHARLSSARQAGTRHQHGPSVAACAKPTAPPTALTAQTPSAICPRTPQHSGPRRDKVTHHGTEKKRPQGRVSAARGRFRRWWQVLGSNQRRLSRRFYRPLLPPPSYGF